jgi:hypothetical protein
MRRESSRRIAATGAFIHCYFPKVSMERMGCEKSPQRAAFLDSSDCFPAQAYSKSKPNNTSLKSVA